MEMTVEIALNDPTPIAFRNVYEEGDIWMKIKGCEGCSHHLKCCGTCPMSSEKGCFYHLEKRNDGGMKPHHCIVNPLPSTCKKNCQLEFKCTKGSMEGKIRRVRDRGDVFV
jgi:hypothetical protein